jgi:hypothetical protein
MAHRSSEIIRIVGKRRLLRDLDGREAWEAEAEVVLLHMITTVTVNDGHGHERFTSSSSCDSLL